MTPQAVDPKCEVILTEIRRVARTIGGARANKVAPRNGG
jgi:hypothetical protein